MTDFEKGTDGLNEQDVHNIKDNYFGLKLPLGMIADKLNFRLSQVMRAVTNQPVKPVKRFMISCQTPNLISI